MNRFILTITSLALLFMLSSKTVLAQGGDQTNLPKEAKITGIIKDASTNEAIPYASVAIYNAKDSTLVTGALSTDNGSFAIGKLPFGKFYIVVSFVGYTNQKVKNITLFAAQKTADLGVIKVNSSAIALKGVVVVGNAPPVTYQIDKKVINIAQNITAAGGTLAEALQNAPSVQTDVEGNITLRGSSNFTVYIDGRPSPIAGSEALQQMPASLVQNVEIITNPSAKYDADGGAGILNIVTKKQKVQGMSGSVNVSAGTGNKYNTNLTLNYKVNKFNFTLGGDYSDNQSPFKSTSNVTDTLSQQELKKQVINGNGSLQRQGKGMRLGIDYAINDKNSITLTGSMGDRTFDRTFNSNYHDQYIQSSNPSPIDIYYLDNVTPEVQRSYKNLNLDYLLKLDGKGQQLSAAAYYTGGPSNSVSTLQVDTTDVNLHSLGKNKVLQQSAQNSNQTDFRTKIDYVLPFNTKGKLEAGYQGRYLNSNGENTVSNFSGNTWVQDSSQRDKLNFKDYIQAGYATLTNSMPLFDYMVGLRAEYENRVLNQEITNQAYKLNRIDFFPTVHLTRQLPFNLQMQASYTRRINRPQQWDINPFIIHLDPQTIRQGNPGLLPEFANSFELNLEKKLTDASFVSIEGFMRETSNLIQQISIFDPTTQITNITSTNINHDRSMGAEFMTYLEPAKWFNINSSLNVFNYQMFGTPIPSVANSINTWNFRFSPTFHITGKTNVQFSYVYNAPSITAQGTRSGFYTSSMAIKQSILKRKGNLILQVRNLFGPTDMITTTEGAHQYKYTSFQREPQVFMLTFNYRINNYKVKENSHQNQDSTNENKDQEGEGPAF
jgi:outer membrane receptor protein involved in Fe transport